jgi:hypothetical protein
MIQDEWRIAMLGKELVHKIKEAMAKRNAGQSDV